MARISLCQAGVFTVVAAAFAALAVSLYGYLAPLTGINGSLGALLVCISSVGLMIGGVLLSASKNRIARFLWFLLGLIAAVGTFLAAYFLHLPALMGLMVVVAIGLALIQTSAHRHIGRKDITDVRSRL
jgi:hypothetical protein